MEYEQDNAKRQRMTEFERVQMSQRVREEAKKKLFNDVGIHIASFTPEYRDCADKVCRASRNWNNSIYEPFRDNAYELFFMSRPFNKAWIEEHYHPERALTDFGELIERLYDTDNLLTETIIFSRQISKNYVIPELVDNIFNNMSDVLRYFLKNSSFARTVKTDHMQVWESILNKYRELLSRYDTFDRFRAQPPFPFFLEHGVEVSYAYNYGLLAEVMTLTAQRDPENENMVGYGSLRRKQRSRRSRKCTCCGQRSMFL